MIQFCNKPRKITLMFVVRDKTKVCNLFLFITLHCNYLYLSSLSPSEFYYFSLNSIFLIQSPESALKAKLKEDIEKVKSYLSPCHILYKDLSNGCFLKFSFPLIFLQIWDSLLTPSRSCSNLQLHNFFQVICGTQSFCF